MKDREVTWKIHHAGQPSFSSGLCHGFCTGCTCWHSTSGVWLNVLWCLSPFSLHEVTSVSNVCLVSDRLTLVLLFRWSPIFSPDVLCFSGSPFLTRSSFGEHFNYLHQLESALLSGISRDSYLSQYSQIHRWDFLCSSLVAKYGMLC